MDLGHNPRGTLDAAAPGRIRRGGYSKVGLWW